MQNLKLINNICFFFLVLFMISIAPLRAMDMNGIYECRLGWSWLTTKVEVVGYSQTPKEGVASLTYVNVDGKRYTEIHNSSFMNSGISPRIILESEKDKRTRLEFHQSSSDRTYRSEGVAVVIETKSFSEKDGSKWESEFRYCEKQ